MQPYAPRFTHSSALVKALAFLRFLDEQLSRREPSPVYLLQLPKTLDAKLAAIGLDAMIFGLISNWLADRNYVKLERDAEALIDRYLSCLGAGQMPKARVMRKSPAKRSAKSLH